MIIRPSVMQVIHVGMGVLCLTALAQAYDPDDFHMGPRGPHDMMEVPGPEMIDIMGDQMGFDEAQRVQMRQIMEKYQGRFQEIQERVQQEMDEVRQQMEAELKAVMTPEQHEMMEQMGDMPPGPHDGSPRGEPWSWQPSGPHEGDHHAGDHEHPEDHHEPHVKQQGYRVIKPQ